MSGGVDSAVAAYLLQKEGYDVCGVTLRTWVGENGQESRCCEIDDARRTAWKLGIRYYALNSIADFEEKVTRPFVRDYLSGLTPNPCIECNRYVKWERMQYAAKVMEADYIATGHYAYVLRTPDGRYTVKKALHAEKDQTYMLYRLTQEQLKMTLMPLGGYSKEDVRRIAEEAGLDIAGKPDSQEICFVPDGHYADFVEKNADRVMASYEGYSAENIQEKGSATCEGCSADNNSENGMALCSDNYAEIMPEKIPASYVGCSADNIQEKGAASCSDNYAENMPEKAPASCSGYSSVKNPEKILPSLAGRQEGFFVDENGTPLGRHKGIIHYTVGQRKGLGIALGHPIYVSRIDAVKNEVVLAPEKSLYSSTVLCRRVCFQSIPGMDPGQTLRARAKIRYHHEAAAATLQMQEDGNVLILFDAPVRAAAPGQSAVFYDDSDCVIGGGIICPTA